MRKEKERERKERGVEWKEEERDKNENRSDKKERERKQKHPALFFCVERQGKGEEGNLIAKEEGRFLERQRS